MCSELPQHPRFLMEHTYVHSISLQPMLIMMGSQRGNSRWGKSVLLCRAAGIDVQRGFYQPTGSCQG